MALTARSHAARDAASQLTDARGQSILGPDESARRAHNVAGWLGLGAITGPLLLPSPGSYLVR
jgi:hypothetical protein